MQLLESGVGNSFHNEQPIRFLFRVISRKFSHMDDWEYCSPCNNTFCFLLLLLFLFFILQEKEERCSENYIVIIVSKSSFVKLILLNVMSIIKILTPVNFCDIAFGMAK